MQSNGEHVEGQTALNAMMAEVPKNLKKIAGKSLPIEVGCERSLRVVRGSDKGCTQKFVSRKARKFAAQNHRLILPAIELSYFFGTVSDSVFVFRAVHGFKFYTAAKCSTEITIRGYLASYRFASESYLAKCARNL